MTKTKRHADIVSVTVGNANFSQMIAPDTAYPLAYSISDTGLIAVLHQTGGIVTLGGYDMNWTFTENKDADGNTFTELREILLRHKFRWVMFARSEKVVLRNLFKMGK